MRGKYHDFYPYEKLILEIGMGMGDFITALCKEHPENLYIGLEKDETCVARAIQKAEELKLENLLVIQANAQNLTNYFFAGEVNLIYLQFSDPWPKKEHYKRRLTYEDYLRLYDFVLAEKGEIIFKTDNAGFYEYSLPSMTSYGFQLAEMSLDYHRDGLHYPLTGYEAKFTEMGMPIYYALFRKK